MIWLLLTPILFIKKAFRQRRIIIIQSKFSKYWIIKMIRWEIKLTTSKFCLWISRYIKVMINGYLVKYFHHNTHMSSQWRWTTTPQRDYKKGGNSLVFLISLNVFDLPLVLVQAPRLWDDGHIGDGAGALHQSSARWHLPRGGQGPGQHHVTRDHWQRIWNRKIKWKYITEERKTHSPSKMRLSKSSHLILTW